MKGNGFYILVLVLVTVYFIPSEILLQFALVVALLIAAIVGFVIYKFRKAFMKFKEQAQNGASSTTNSNQKEEEMESESEVKSIKDDNFDMSKSNVIDTDYEEV